MDAYREPKTVVASDEEILREVSDFLELKRQFEESFRQARDMKDPVPFYSLENAGRRFFTLEGIQEAIDDTYIRPGREYIGRLTDAGQKSDYLRNVRRAAAKGINIPFTERKIYGSKYAGRQLRKGLADPGMVGKTLRNVVNVIPGLNLLGDVFDVAEAVVGVARRDGVRQGQAKELAKEMAAQGLSLDDAMKYIESTPELQDLAGNIGADDFAKTAAYAAWTGGPSLNPIAAAAGAITAGDLQREKAIRNRMFKDEFMKASANSQQGMGF